MMQKKLKPSTEIKNLKEELKELRELTMIAGVPTLFVYHAKICFRPPTKDDIIWAEKKIKEYEEKFG